jgi:multidrug efflux pump
VQIGLVVLVGLACKNAILIVQYAHQLELEGKSIFDATQIASRLRLRPILMTSFAFILGVVPLVVASGAGAEMRRSLGIAVFYGMLGVTLFGIFLTPVFFYVIQSLSHNRLFQAAGMKWFVSLFFGAVSGGNIGYLLSQLLNLVLMPSLLVGIAAGMVGVSLVLGLFEGIRYVRSKDDVLRFPDLSGGENGVHTILR